MVEDSEVAAMRFIVDAFQPLTDSARRRVLYWAWWRFVAETNAFQKKELQELRDEIDRVLALIKQKEPDPPAQREEGSDG